MRLAGPQSQFGRVREQSVARAQVQSYCCVFRVLAFISATANPQCKSRSVFYTITNRFSPIQPPICSISLNIRPCNYLIEFPVNIFSAGWAHEILHSFLVSLQSHGQPTIVTHCALVFGGFQKAIWKKHALSSSFLSTSNIWRNRTRISIKFNLDGIY